MGSLDNRLRKKWQDYSGHQAADAELSFYQVFNELFKGSPLTIIKHPPIFDRIYVDFPLEQQEMGEIYIPKEHITKHGIKPDFLIRNEASGKEIYVEVKRQDGWVENKKRTAGRGNAHERLCKYFTPDLLKLMRAKGRISPEKYPFWIVFQGDITRDICRVREIRFWFDGNDENVTFWRDRNNPDPVIQHFLKYILPILDN